MNWKDIKNFEGLYQANRLGEIKSLPKSKKYYGNDYMTNEKKLKPGITRGYSRVVLVKNGIHHYLLVHRLIALTFIPNPKKRPQINHINGLKTDNRVENLEWCNQSENQKHAYRIGLQKQTLKFNHPFLKTIEVYKNGELIFSGSSRDVSKKFKICRKTLSAIRRSKKLRDLTLKSRKNMKSTKYKKKL